MATPILPFRRNREGKGYSFFIHIEKVKIELNKLTHIGEHRSILPRKALLPLRYPKRAKH
jgi:hypothetical protein